MTEIPTELNPIYSAHDAQFLLSTVAVEGDPLHEGHVTYAVSVDPDTGVQTLTVKFTGSDGAVMRGEWSLTLVGIEKVGETNG